MNRIERYYVSSNMLDAFAGSAAGLITQLVVVNQLGFVGTELGILNSLSVILYLVSAVPIGKIVDTLPPVTVLISALTLKLVLLTTLAYLYLSAGLSFWTILILQVLQSLVGIFIDNSQIITAVSIQNAEGNAKLVPRLESADKAIGIVAPGVVALIAAGELYGEGYIGAAVLALSALSLIVFPVRKALQQSAYVGREKNPHQGDEDEHGGSLLTGFRLIVHNKECLVPVLLIAAGNLGLAFIDSPKTLFLLREVNMDPSGFSSLNIVSATAGLLASFGAVRLIEHFKFAALITLATLGQVLSTLAFLSIVVLHAPVFIFAAISTALWSVSIVLINVSAMNFFVSKLPQGKIGIGLSSMRTSVMFVVPLGALVGGYCADHAGYAVSSLIWCLIAFITFLIGASLLSKRQTSIAVES
ncbi:MFS transporter [Corynebacterium poyangense]|uniref:MFS transporter n=1 Tax=Corynebacterium poyangense TaxID=2684405 RepID=A0A7H0SM27_9CORY|nr:MFS transporter [Corynebacterium poyangense]QNQ89602.1 MFS transporter [Corynebacterium poyangense]